MSDLFWIDSSDDEVVENADWVEITTLFRNNSAVSREDLARAISQDGNRSEEHSQVLAESVFNELADREQVCGGLMSSSVYPFELVENNTILRKKRRRFRKFDEQLLYLFLLTITRADMSARPRRLAGQDPTMLFETLCADILINFWGGRSDFSDSLVFGTAQQSARLKSFRDKIEYLCTNLIEGGGWKKTARSPGAGDSNLDVVVWRRFRDERQGGLVGFAQCKTGKHWRNGLTNLRPESFCRHYMCEPLLIEPLRIYMVPCRVNHLRWEQDCLNGGLLFDRCRIVQYSQSLSQQVMSGCRAWFNAVYERNSPRS